MNNCTGCERVQLAWLHGIRPSMNEAARKVDSAVIIQMARSHQNHRGSNPGVTQCHSR